MRIDLYKITFLNRKAIPWIIWSIAGLFYFYEIILRMVPGIMTGELMREFHITATQLGVFTAAYYLSYTLMQIPAGLIVDRFSIRHTMLVAILLCISGFLIVHVSRLLGFAEAGRFIIGLGSAFAYISALKAASIWLSKKHFGLASCIVDSLGMIGGVFTDIVLVRMNIGSGYQSSIIFLLITGLVVAGLIFFIFRSAPPHHHGRFGDHTIIRDKTHVIDKLKLIVKNPQMWLIGIVGCLFYLPSSVIGDVWGLPYLRTVYHFSVKESAMLMATLFAGWTLVGPFLGALSDKLERRCLPIKISLLIDAILFSIIIFAPLLTKHLLPHSVLYVMFFLIGVVTGTHPLVFALAKENFPLKIAGTVIAATNTLIMLGGLLFQPLVGFLLDFSSHGEGHYGGHFGAHYTASDYSFALSIIPISLIISIFIMFFVKETGFQLSKNDPD